MQIAKNFIAFRHFANENTERHNVRKLTKGDVLALHFLPDRVWAFFTSIDVDLEPLVRYHVLQLGNNPADHVVILLTQEFEARKDRIPCLRIDMLEGKVFKLFLDVVHTDAFGKRRINL